MAADIGQIGDILYFSLFIPGVKLVRVPLSPKQHPKRYVCVLGLQTLKDRSCAACHAKCSLSCQVQTAKIGQRRFLIFGGRAGDIKSASLRSRL